MPSRCRSPDSPRCQLQRLLEGLLFLPRLLLRILALSCVTMNLTLAPAASLRLQPARPPHRAARCHRCYDVRLHRPPTKDVRRNSLCMKRLQMWLLHAIGRDLVYSVVYLQLYIYIHTPGVVSFQLRYIKINDRSGNIVLRTFAWPPRHRLQLQTTQTLADSSKSAPSRPGSHSPAPSPETAPVREPKHWPG